LKKVFLSQGQQIATDLGTWTPVLDAKSEANWQISVGKALGATRIIQAGNFISGPPSWGAAELIANENDTALTYVAQFSHHNCTHS
jgi:hypothetical protein